MVPLASVAKLATRWRHLHQLQLWPPDGTTCISCKFSHQVESLALPHCLGLLYWHYQLVFLSWYLYQQESQICKICTRCLTYLVCLREANPYIGPKVSLRGRLMYVKSKSSPVPGGYLVVPKMEILS